MRGTFAFAVIETRQVRGAPGTDIFLARDPVGIKRPAIPYQRWSDTCLRGARGPRDLLLDLFVPRRMCWTPIPSTPDDVIDSWILELPTEVAANFLGAGDKDGRVTDAPRTFLR